MRGNTAQRALALTALLAAPAAAQRQDCRAWTDAASDVLVRRTDLGNDGPLHAMGTMPDLRSVALCGWQPDNPEPNCYTGQTVDMKEAHILRLDIVFGGLMNPPGPVGIGEDFAPYIFGNSPVLGYIDFDVDDDRDTGGELGEAAVTRYLANVGRFARLPHDFDDRTAKSGDEVDKIFQTSPQYERSGADFAFVMCGCFTPQVLQLVGDGDGFFDEGEEWLVYGRFFERAKGYREASAAYNGSEPGLYDPVVQIRFHHDTTVNETTVTLVFGLDAEGAAFLRDGPVQDIDLDVSNHASIEEALADIIAGANAGGIPEPAWTLVRNWKNDHACAFLDMTEWGEITALVGAPYTQPESTFFAWSDTAYEKEVFGDLNGDELVDSADEQLVRQAVFARDGGPRDADGDLNGVWVLMNPGWNFSLYDTDGNMRVDLYDQELYGDLADFDGNGHVNIQDFVKFLNEWAGGLPLADFNLDGDIDTKDFIAFLNEYVN